MPALIQTHLPLKIETRLGDEAFAVLAFSGMEGVSIPFSYSVQLISKDDAIHPKEMLHTPAVLTIPLPGGESRQIHGMFGRFAQTGRNDDETDPHVFYEAEIVPSLYFLSLSRDSRTFQEKTVVEIVETVLKEQGIADFKVRCSGSYSKREYCVQYQETHLNFVSRLMEEEGIFYFFEQTGSKHVLVITDSNRSVEPCPSGSSARYTDVAMPREPSVRSLQGVRSVFSGKVTLRDYDPLQPSLKLETTFSGRGEGEVFRYPGGFTTVEQGDRIARLQLEAEEALRQQVRGEGFVPALQAGYRFDLSGHFNQFLNGTYMLLQVQQSAMPTEEGFDVRTGFTAIPHDVPFRPQRTIPKPVMLGPQTAVVVGKSGEEIWVDKYGRVKIQFHWDRRGQKDENSSCWVRVASSWAGKSWGAIQIPRIGQEVVVAFLDGDPDRPIIVGSMYNAEQMPPYSLPDNQTQSGVKSRSTKQGSAETFNEIRLEDRKGAEQIYVHAEKNLDVLVENDETRKVGFEKKDKGDQSVEVFNNQTLKVGAGGGEAADGSQTVEVHKNQTVTVKTGDQTTTIEQGHQTITIKQGNRSVTLDQGNESIQLKMGNRTVKLDKGDDSLTLTTGNLKTTLNNGNASLELLKGNATTKATLGKISEEAMQGIEMKVGMNSIKIDQKGVEIKGMMVKVEGTVQTEVKGLMTQINGSAMLKVQGGITMIN